MAVPKFGDTAIGHRGSSGFIFDSADWRDVVDVDRRLGIHIMLGMHALSNRTGARRVIRMPFFDNETISELDGHDPPTMGRRA